MIKNTVLEIISHIQKQMTKTDVHLYSCIYHFHSTLKLEFIRKSIRAVQPDRLFLDVSSVPTVYKFPFQKVFLTSLKLTLIHLYIYV